MNWWQSRRLSVTARLATATDRPALAALLAKSSRRYGVLAVEEQVALLNNGVSVMASTGDDVGGFLGLSLRAATGNPSERWADAALVAVAPTQPASRTLRVMLETALPALRARSVTGVACMTVDRWLTGSLQDAGFVQVDRVMGYLRTSRKRPSRLEPKATLRRAGPSDADTVLELNAAGFTPFWRYDTTKVLSWLLTADHAVLAEVNGKPVGFALTTTLADGEYAHLIRVATCPSVRGQGIGRQMIVDAIYYAMESGAPGLALNTQVSNTVSRRLYETLGFRPSGPSLAVMVYRL